MKSILNQSNYLEDAMFRHYITEHLKQLANDRQRVIENTSLYNRENFITTEIVLKRGAYTRLLERGIMTTDNVLKECVKLMNQKSELSSTERRFLGTLLSAAMAKTILYYEKSNK